MTASDLRCEILDLVAAYAAAQFVDRPFVAGVTPVPVSGRVFDGAEISTLVDAALDFWLTTGRFALEFERRLTSYLGTRHAVLCNSGSSANLLALSALTSPKLGERRLLPGDEVITAATGFPTTVNPIIQNGLVPVFVDVSLGTYEAPAEKVAEAIGPRTRAIMMAHTLGNPFDLGAVCQLASEHNLWLIEDNCDALGSTYDGRLTGTFGDLATISFYPAHHITTGEGGCVLTQRGSLRKLVESFRDWGRDCWCETGAEDTCGRRFDWQLGALPYGYDHKYTYTHVGYNLKLTDMQAAVGVAQMDKLPDFVNRRRHNWAYLRDALNGLEEFFVLPEPTPGSEPSWFGFCLTVRPDAGFSRRELVQFLASRKIGTRELFGGNLTRQPAYAATRHRTSGDLLVADTVMQSSFWIGVYPALTAEALDFVAASLHDFAAGNRQERSV